MTSLRRLLPLTFALLVLLPSAALAAGVRVRFDGSSPSGRPFPSDVFTVRDPATNTLHAESDELLDQHTRYALVVTRDVRDAAGGRIEGSRGRHGGDDEDFDFEEFGDQDLRIAALSIFTTQSVTSTLEKIRASIKHSHRPPAVGRS